MIIVFLLQSLLYHEIYRNQIKHHYEMQVVVDQNSQSIGVAGGGGGFPTTISI